MQTVARADGGFLSKAGLADVGGVAAWPDEFVITSGTGLAGPRAGALDQTGKGARTYPGVAWDNHLPRL